MSTASVSAQTLAKMPNPYVVKVVDFPAGPAVVCAGEGYGPVVAIDPRTWNVRTIADGPGGCLDVTPVPGYNALYMIGGSFVGYDFHRSGVYRLDLPAAVWGRGDGDNDADDPVSSAPNIPIRLFDLPFAHRLQSFRNRDGVHLVAASIAQSKHDRDDWSRPGAVFVADLGDGLAAPERGAEPPAPAARAGIPGDVPIPLRPILGELHKNHGLTTVGTGHMVHPEETVRSNSTGDLGWLYISGTEGTFRAPFPETNESSWTFERVVDHEISELFFIDLDGDGVDELVTIEPFHGDRLAVYRIGRSETGSEGTRPGRSRSWGTRRGDVSPGRAREPLGSAPPELALWLEKEISFGHGLWTGMIGGVPSILVGNRSGHKNLEMIRIIDGNLVTETIAEGTGTAQVAVVPGGIARAGGLRHDAPRDATNTRGTTLPSDATEGPDYIIASNQEQDEIVLYTVG
ncbi:MAG: hypothetical protein ACOCV0_01480 [Alkalispirochaeta sp.]